MVQDQNTFTGGTDTSGYGPPTFTFQINHQKVNSACFNDIYMNLSIQVTIPMNPPLCQCIWWTSIRRIIDRRVGLFWGCI